MYKLGGKLKQVKVGLKNLHCKDFARLDERIDHLIDELEDIQEKLVGRTTDVVLQQKKKRPLLP